MGTAQRLRESLDPDTQKVEGPTEYMTETNRYPLNCGICGTTLYVDAAMYERATSVWRWDPSNTPFYCEECEAEFTDPDFGRER